MTVAASRLAHKDEKSEQLREMNVMREVAMKQREADNSILKEFIRTIKD